MLEISNILGLWVLIFSLFLFIISMFAYLRNTSKRIFFVTIAFAIFFIKGIILFYGIFNQNVNNIISSGFGIFLDFIILTFLIATIIRK